MKIYCNLRYTNEFYFCMSLSGLIWISTRALVLLGWFFTRRALRSSSTPRRGSQVRTGPSAGGSRIRTIGPAEDPAVVVISGLVAPPSPLRQAEPTRAPLSKPWSSNAVLTVRSGCCTGRSAGFSPFRIFSDVNADLAIDGREAGSIADRAAGCSRFAPRIR